jgi:hypothetical protein
MIAVLKMDKIAKKHIFLGGLQKWAVDALLSFQNFLRVGY